MLIQVEKKEEEMSMSNTITKEELLSVCQANPAGVWCNRNKD